MERQITNFIRALRSSQVRVSTSETLDAVRTVNLIGYSDRRLLRNSLSCVLAKSQDEKVRFDELSSKEMPPEEKSDSTDSQDDILDVTHREPDLVALMESGDEAAITLI